MKLKKFRVTNFRSVEDSGWIETDDVTALIGTNESGKTNILLPLWKFNPAKEGGIVPTADYPRKLYSTFRIQEPKPVFIYVVFDADDNLARKLAAITGMTVDKVREIEVTRRFDAQYGVDFPQASLPRTVTPSKIVDVLQDAEREIDQLNPLKSEKDLKESISSSLQRTRLSIATEPAIGVERLKNVLNTLDGVDLDSAPKTSKIVPRYRRACDDIRVLYKELARPHPRDVKAATELVLNSLPKFVYYSNYGNLDSEIYLPQVITNLARADLGLKEQAKARTLKVLFEFVKLKPDEILQLGRDFKEPNRRPTDEELAAITEKKKQRSILLQSASTLLTDKFRGWWKQGEYRFRFEADGDHFRIWVSDDKRTEEIELEGRSTGLQWFLSFYLVFLVERADAHEDAILLLDEPGISLHPLAQRDLSEFFDSLAQDNQLIYTCHSPFLVDADRLDRARKVYVAADGTSKVTADLAASNGDIAQRGAAYAVHAALGLTVAESLLLGCKPIVVEGPSDQHYLTAIKILLIASGRIRPGRELVFPPANGTKGVKAVSSILSAPQQELPVVLLDSDSAGRSLVESLGKDLYAGNMDLVLNIQMFTDIQDSEVEDLIPTDVLVRQLDRWQRAAEVPFADEVQNGKPIVLQIEAWATKYKIELPKPGWKVELAKRVKQQLLADGPAAVANEVLDQWTRLFDAFSTTRDGTTD